LRDGHRIAGVYSESLTWLRKRDAQVEGVRIKLPSRQKGTIY